MTRHLPLTLVLCTAVGAPLVAIPSFESFGPADETVVSASPPQQQEVAITMRGAGGRTPRLAVPAFLTAGGDAELDGAASTVSEVLWHDIEFEREFTMISREGAARIPVAPVETLPYATWNEIGADFVLVGTATRTDAALQIEVRVMSVERKISTFAKRYGCTMRSPRLCAHTIADEVHRELFNLDGVARTKIAFTSDRDGERLGGTIEERSIKEIYIADYDGGGQFRVTPNRSLNIAPAWSPDSRLLAYTSYTSGFPDIVVHSLYEARAAVRPARGHADAQNFLPRFSPDGSRIALASSRDGNFEIYTVRPDGTDLRRLTFHVSDDSAPAWSPTGAQIAFTSDRSGSNQIYIMSADGGPAQKITSEPRKADRPTWSPPPFSYIAYSAEVPGGTEIKMVEIGTGTVTQLTEGPGTNESPSVAPNGRHIAFVTTRWGKEQIAIIGRDGKLERRITTAGNNRYPSWSNR